jgi:hypothetical protein
LASLERQRFGVACFFSAMPGDPQHPETLPRSSWLTAHPSARKPHRPGSGTVVHRAQPVDLPTRSALGPCRNGLARASAVTSDRQRFRETAGHRSSISCSWDDAGGRFGLWSRRPGVRALDRPPEQRFRAHPPFLPSDAGQRFVNACERAALSVPRQESGLSQRWPRHKASRFQASLRASVEATSQGKR